MIKVSGLILAAGEAKRFGVPKQLLEWEDTTILGNVIKQFKKSQLSYVYVVLGAYYEKIISNLKEDFANINIIYNENWKKGMFSSIIIGLNECLKNKDDYILIHQGDMPFIKTETIDSFIIRAKVSKPKIVIATVNNKPAHPYMIHNSLINEILEMKDNEGMRPFIRKYFNEAEKIPVSYLEGKQDIDTWEEYRRLKNGIYME